MYYSFAFCKFGFEESDLVDFAISCCYPKTLATSASREHRVTSHDPLVACMSDIGIL